LDLTLSADEQAFRDKLRAWLDDNHPGSEPADADTAFEFRRDWQKRLHAAGYTGLSWPAEFGGQGDTVI
jgi:alkylation response protein AidB-like acyl-CoA dehydrogenase